MAARPQRSTGQAPNTAGEVLDSFNFDAFLTDDNPTNRPVVSTISRDGTAGLQAEQDKNLVNVFKRQDSSLSRPSGVPNPQLASGLYLHDYQQQLMLLERQQRKHLEMRASEATYQSPHIPMPSPGGVPGHAAQDYSQQLLLLERQNRRRLDLQREALQDPQLLPTPVHPQQQVSQAYGTANPQTSSHESVLDPKILKNAGVIWTKDHRSSGEDDTGASSSQVRTDSTEDGAPGTRSITETNLCGSKESAGFLRFLLDTIHSQKEELSFMKEALSRQAVELASSTDEAPAAPIDSEMSEQHIDPSGDEPRFEELHIVSCQHTDAHNLLYHDAPTIKDIQSWKTDEQGFFRTIATGQSIIGTSLGHYLERRKSLHMVALRVYQCPEVLRPHRTRRNELDATLDHFKSGAKLYLLATSPVLQDRLATLARYSLPAGYDLADLYTFQVPPSVSVIGHDDFYFHHCAELAREAFSMWDAGADDCGSALKSALQIAQTAWDENCQQAQDLLASGFVSRSTLSRLFHPNMPVLTYSEESKGDLVVCSVRDTPVMDADGRIALPCWQWNFDGQRFYRKLLNLTVELVDHGPVPITSLKVYPLTHAPIDVVTRLTKRAEKMWDLREPTFVEYTGWDAKHDQEYVNARFMIDVTMHGRLHERGHPFYDQCRSEKMQDLPLTIPIHGPRPEGIALLLLPATVVAFNLRDKAWSMLRIDNIEDVCFNKSAFDSLIVPADVKELVRALVDTQGTISGPGDIVADKGNGLIMLLHGGPGTGKTLTAESVAEIAERPLYRVTCGDIGTDPNSVEAYLNTVLLLGKTWNCVVLLDEADVFLEERDLFDLKRNSLVSVFLRTLEYYDGILILTSNRVGTFDEAFKSRIQVAIHYPDLTRVARKMIWQNFLARIEEDDSQESDVAGIMSHIDQLKDLELNGRQIRNAVGTARRLALFRKETLGWNHIAQVVGVVAKFTIYLERTHKHKDVEHARELGLRA